MTDEGRAAVQGSEEERELGGYLEQLIAAALQNKASRGSVERWEMDEVEPVAPTTVGSPDASRDPRGSRGEHRTHGC